MYTARYRPGIIDCESARVGSLKARLQGRYNRWGFSWRPAVLISLLLCVPLRLGVFA